MNRLFEIVYLLLERKQITAKELAQRFEVSTRTIYRDVELLSQSKIPIYCNKGKGGGICLLEDYVLDKSLLSEEEQNQILFALQGMNKIGSPEEKGVLEKMSQIFQKRKTNWIEVDFSNWGSIGETENTFQLIKEAILKQQVLEFTYYNSSGEKKKRLVEPLQIYFKDKAWYLKSYCREKQDYRLFKISRMQDLNLLKEKFERELPIFKQEKKDVKTVTLKLEISKEMSYRVYDEFRAEEVQKNPKGDFEITVTYPANDWLYGYLLSFGEWVKILAPIEVKKELQGRLEKSLKNYFK